MEKKDMLFVIDMQNDFIDGALGSSEAQSIVPKVVELVNTFHENNGKVIFTLDSHFSEDYHTSIEGQNVPKHCMYGTEGWCLCDELLDARLETDKTFIKESFMSKTDDIHDIYPDYPKSITIVGLCTDICVISNALLLRRLYPEVSITVDASCCAGTTLEKHNAALDVMESCCINVINRN